MFKHKTKNYEIRSSKPISKSMIEICKKGYQKNKKFFGKDSPFFPINFAHTEEEFKVLAGRFYAPWVKGTCDFNGVNIRGQKLYDESYKKFGGTKKLQLVLTHEITHLFSYFKNLYKGPYWFTEGLAMYVAEQIPGKELVIKKKLTKKQAKKQLFYRIIIKKLSEDMYAPDYYAIKYLVDTYGLEKLRKLMNSYKKKMNKAMYERNFKRIYGITYKEFIETALDNYY